MASQHNILSRKTIKGKHIIYEDEFTAICDLSKIVEYLKSDKIPNVIGYPEVINYSVDEISDNNFKKKVFASLPDTKSVKYYFGSNYKMKICYDIAYNDKALVSTNINPSELNNFLKYTEIVEIYKIEDISELSDQDKEKFDIKTKEDFNKLSLVKLKRNCDIVNSAANTLGDNGFFGNLRYYDSYFNNQSMEFFCSLIRDTNLL